MIASTPTAAWAIKVRVRVRVRVRVILILTVSLKSADSGRRTHVSNRRHFVVCPGIRTQGIRKGSSDSYRSVHGVQ